MQELDQYETEVQQLHPISFLIFASSFLHPRLLVRFLGLWLGFPLRHLATSNVGSTMGKSRYDAGWRVGDVHRNPHIRGTKARKGGLDQDNEEAGCSYGLRADLRLCTFRDGGGHVHNGYAEDILSPYQHHRVCRLDLVSVARFEEGGGEVFCLGASRNPSARASRSHSCLDSYDYSE